MSIKRKLTENQKSSVIYGNRNDHNTGFDKLFDEYHKRQAFFGLSFLLCGSIINSSNRETNRSNKNGKTWI